MKGEEKEWQLKTGKGEKMAERQKKRKEVPPLRGLNIAFKKPEEK